MLSSYEHRRRVSLALLVAGLVTTVITQAVWSQALKSKAEIERVIVIDKLTVQNGVVSGEIINKSPNLLRDVQLLVRYTWRWDDEKKPGKTDPGTSTLYTLPKEVPAGGRLPFTFSPSPPLPKIAGGRFETTVMVAAFAEVISQAR